MTPHTRLAQLYRALAETHEQIAEEQAAGEWVDQRQSPLGRRLHCKLVREGKLPGKKLGRRVLVSKLEIERFIKGGGTAANEIGEDERMLREMGAHHGRS